MKSDTVTVMTGVVSGAPGNLPGVRVFKGLPYAAPPVGDLRWRPPHPPIHWSGVRPAHTFGPRATQTNPFPDMIWRSGRESEDSLTLSVWTPARSASDRLPVMVWIHGGGFFSGSGDEVRHEGSRLASAGVVVVVVNYRLGVLGFLAHPELSAESPYGASGNYGLLDQVAALQWVQHNIAGFGGDPRCVTVFGESAGSFSASALMASPRTEGLFHRVIGQSGAYLGNTALPLHPLRIAERMGTEYGRSLGATSLAKLRTIPPSDLIRAIGRESTRFAPIIDGHLLTADPWEIFARGTQRRVPLLAGWNSAEAALPPVSAAEFVEIRRRAFPDDEAVAVRVYPSTDDRTAHASAVALASNDFIGYNTWRWLETHAATSGMPTYRYLFDQVVPPPPGALASDPHGAGHATDIEYVFGTLDTRALPWRDDDRRVANLMAAWWTNFATTGNPNGPDLPAWPAWDSGGSRQLMRIHADAHAEPEQHRDRLELHDAREKRRRSGGC